MYQAPGRTIGSRFASLYGFPQAASVRVSLQLHHHSTSLATPVGITLLHDPTVSWLQYLRRIPS